MFALERGPSRLVSRKPYFLKYPPTPHSTEFLALVDVFPSGFRRLALQGIVPVELITIIVRATLAFRQNSNSSTYVPFSATENLCHSERRKYLCFSESCPWLLAPDDETHPILKPLTLALMLWCCNAFVKVRSYTCIYAGVLRALTVWLLDSVDRHLSTNDEARDSTVAAGEKDCLLWIWIVAIDSWRFDTSNKLLPTGKQLLVCFERLFPYEFADADVLQEVLDKFFLTEELRGAVKTLWNEL